MLSKFMPNLSIKQRIDQQISVFKTVLSGLDFLQKEIEEKYEKNEIKILDLETENNMLTEEKERIEKISGKIKSLIE